MNVTLKTTHLVDADDEMGWEISSEVQRAQAAKSERVIVHYQWLLACAEEERYVELEPQYVRYVPEEVLAQLQLKMDCWGDRYTEMATEQSLATAMALVRAQHEAATSKQACVQGCVPGRVHDGGSTSRTPAVETATAATAAATAAAAAAAATAATPCATAACAQSQPYTASASAIELQLRLLDDRALRALTTRFTMLRGVVAYAPTPHTQITLRILGASVLESPTAAATHAVLLASTPPERVRTLKQQFRDARIGSDRLASFDKWVVTEAWLAACIQSGRRVDEGGFTHFGPAT
eukprot:4403632-Pleurochrysis_carterae.AAC.1